jgi:RnfABCDGE-type electron transport complex B subunit
LFDQSFIVSVLTMGGLGLVFAICLAIASVKLRVKEDPIVEKLLDVLPGTNCGACGFPGCHALAEKMASKDAPINACPAGGQEVTDLVAEALGIESVAANRSIAVVLCRGGEAETKKSASYRGDMTCAGAVITGGEKDCAYSCLGYGDCVTACCFASMGMNSNGMPEVFFDKCVGCGACARACPRDVIEMHPEEQTLFVYCRNKEKGPIAKKACTVACIGCALCKKDCEVDGGIKIEKFLAVIDYELCPQDDAAIKRCPTKCILNGENAKMTSASFTALSRGKAQGS